VIDAELLPLRTIVFQLLLMVVAIALEAIVLQRVLKLDYKTSVQYATTINLLSTAIGWLIFFIVQSLLPPDQLKLQLIGFILLEQLFPNPLQNSLPFAMIPISFGIFVGTFAIKWIGLQILEVLLEKDQKPESESTKNKPGGFLLNNRLVNLQKNSQAYAVFLANAASFSAILVLLFVRLLDQNRRV
jgi:hypothetical protein